MVMGGQKGYPLKCESCGHEDAIFFRERMGLLKEMTFKVVGSKCPKCGAKMTVDPNKRILF
jgi:predicted RNA-binding Zn-ribbon protein involved in translation (DUF1610 family)